MNEKQRNISAARVFSAHEPSAEDIARAKQLPANACPRRYCWWWQTLAFDWDVSVDDGCRFQKIKKHPSFVRPNEPCVRCVPTSAVDQFEPREPHLLEDGLDGVQWFQRHHDFNGTKISQEWLQFMATGGKNSE